MSSTEDRAECRINATTTDGKELQSSFDKTVLGKRQINQVQLPRVCERVAKSAKQVGKAPP